MVVNSAFRRLGVGVRECGRNQVTNIRFAWALALLLVVLTACSQQETPPVEPQPTTASPSAKSNQQDAAGEPDRTSATQTPADREPAATAAGVQIADPATVPMVDVSIHHVPLEDIIFDTFGGSPRFVPLSEAGDELIVDLRDAIVPVARPVYGGPDALAWLEDDHLVMGYVSGASTFAYPINVLDLHEIVNDVIDGVPLVVTYCPLCFSGVVFSRELDGRLLTFGNTSALYQSDMVMYDHQTGSYWF